MYTRLMPFASPAMSLRLWLILVLIACSALACDGEGASSGEADAGTAPAARDRVCPEVYVCIVNCRSGRFDGRDACVDGCLDAATAAARALATGVLDCGAAECADAPGAPYQDCLFRACAGPMGACLRAARPIRQPCDAGPPNEQGVGTQCEEITDCEGLAAYNCPWAIPPVEDRARRGLPKWCSHLCEEDSDCGGGGICWLRGSEDSGIIGSCALSGCLIDDPGVSD